MNKLKKYIGLSLLLLFFNSCAEETRVPMGTHFWVYTTFSPNGDGLNDRFQPMVIYGVLISEYHISIYNPNLQLMFQSDDINNGWDPGPDPAVVPDGSYEYQMIYVASTDSITYHSYISNSTIQVLR